MKHIPEYHFATVEKKWQAYWQKNDTFKTEDASSKPKYYILDMFPYPSGQGLHVGHVEGYTATDIIARLKRMQGYNVLHPMGWDAFGLPAEQYAIKTGTHPRITTEKNIKTYREQIKSIGYSTDWSREIDTTDPGYYRWTQWLFLQLYHQGLAYESYQPVNWCPALGTVLANEEVVDGKSEIGGHPVIKKPIRQWVLQITAYAERLLQDLELVDWPESTKEMQRSWIGKSSGAYVDFAIKDASHKSFEVFTTRPDTLFGVSFCVLAPEHPLVSEITSTKQRDAVESYCQETALKTERSRQEGAGNEKSGVFTGAYALNPVNQQTLPIYIADYVLMNYGSGAIMGVPGHDQRDHAFAKNYGLPILRVIAGGDADREHAAYTGEGTLLNSEFLDGLSKEAAAEVIVAWLSERKIGRKAITYKLRDWVFSRQRYWGEPFPLVHSPDGRVQAVAAADLPVSLPPMEDYGPSENGEPPLAKAREWLAVAVDGLQQGLRETNIMPQWAGSCWYYLRYIDPHNEQEAWSQERQQHWLPVDLYVGGVEHANLHLLYARFWHKVFFDLGLVSTPEPFPKLRHPGMVLGENNEKMSKSRGNVVSPDEVIAEWGADSLRLYEMFMGPFEQAKPWQTAGIAGVNRFLRRLWRLVLSSSATFSDSAALTKLRHQLIQKVSADTEELKFNTAIAAMMEFVNAAYKEEGISTTTATTVVLLLAPYAPHVAEELWEALDHTESIAYAPWPHFDPALVVRGECTYGVMINGKLRATLVVAATSSQDEVSAQARELEAIKKYLAGMTIRKEVFVPGKVVNFVVGPS